MAQGAERLMDSAHHRLAVTAGALDARGQPVMGGTLVRGLKVKGVGDMTIGAGAAMTTIDGLVVDGRANRCAARRVIMQGPAAPHRHVAGATALMDGVNILGVGVASPLIMAAGALRRAGDPALPLVVDAVARVSGDRVDLVAMAGGAGDGPGTGNDVLNRRTDGVLTAGRGIAAGVVAHGTVALVLHKDSGPGAQLLTGIIMAGGAGGAAVLRDVATAHGHDMGVGVLGKIVAAMAIGTGGHNADVVPRGTAERTGNQGAITVGISMAIVAVGVMGIDTADRIAGMAPPTVHGRDLTDRGGKTRMVLMLMTVPETLPIGGMAIDTSGDYANLVIDSAAVAIGAVP